MLLQLAPALVSIAVPTRRRGMIANIHAGNSHYRAALANSKEARDISMLGRQLYSSFFR